MFRRPDSPILATQYKLFGLDPAAQYEFTDLDSGQKRTVSGKELLETGLRVDIDQPRTAVIIAFEKVDR